MVHLAHRDGYGRYVGRVGALAVALGIGAALAANPGTAFADDAGGPDSAASATESSTTAGTPAGQSEPASRSSATGEAGPDAAADAGTDSNNATSLRAERAAERASERAERKAERAAARAAKAAQSAAERAAEVTEIDSAGADSPEVTPDAVAPPAAPDVDVRKRNGGAEKAFGTTISTPAVVDRGRQVDDTDGSEPDASAIAVPAARVAAVASVQKPPDAPDLSQVAVLDFKTVVAVNISPEVTLDTAAGEQPAEVLTAVGAHSAASNTTHTGDVPAPPLPSGTFAGLLALISRQLEYTLFNHRPTMSYDAALNVQTAQGQVTGDLGGSDADGDVLTYTVLKGPKNGSVTVAPDGTFTYTPYAGLAARGGTDTFTVKASDVPGNPFHIHGFALFNGSATAEVTVSVAPTTAVSPLGTADQIAAEKLATQIVNSPIVKLAKLVLKLVWKAAAVKQFALVGGPDAANLALLDQAVDEFALQAALELQLLNSNDPHVLQQVMPPHTWYGETFGGARIFYDNPDTIYRMIPVNNASSYVITGRFDGPLPADTTFSVLTGLTGTTTSVLSGRDLVYNPDGSFTITADSAPADGRPNHLQLPSGVTLITARNTLSDWNTQVPMSLSVQRISGPADNLFSQLGFYAIPVVGSLFSSAPIISQLVQLVPPMKNPPLALQAAETAIVMALGLFMGPQYMAVATTDPDTGELRAPNTLSDPAHNASFLATQLQSAGYFQLADTEALVITIDPGNARYFSVPVTNVWTITDNYWDDQTSLNNAPSQAKANADGTYTFVVSPTDPGVANWVSTGGLNQGTLSIRFQDLDMESSAAPTVSSAVVPLSELATVLPAGTVYVTAAERAAQIALRRDGYNRRYAPYVQA